MHYFMEMVGTLSLCLAEWIGFSAEAGMGQKESGEDDVKKEHFKF